MNEKEKTTELIKNFIRRLAITARISVESDEFAKDEVMEFIRNDAEKTFNLVFSMSDDEFAMTAIMEMVRSMVWKGANK